MNKGVNRMVIPFHKGFKKEETLESGEYFKLNINKKFTQFFTKVTEMWYPNAVIITKTLCLWS